MELRQLEYFIAVAEEANFTRASERVHVAQSGVSAQIRRLERELGQELFDRTPGAVRLTEVGAAMLPYARSALDAVAGARATVDELAGLVRGHVSVGMIVARSALDLPELLSDFHREHPGVEITLAEDNTERLLEMLQAGELDLALVGLAAPPPEAIETEVLSDEELVAVVGRGDALSAKSRISLSALRDRALISLPPGTGMRTALDAACAAAGLNPRIAFEASDPVMLVELAARGLGVAIVPASLAAARAAHVHSLTVSTPELRSRLELAWRAGGPISPAARALLAQARTTLRRSSAQAA
jgi:DNA-binding transcriptional LysR family regulator